MTEQEKREKVVKGLECCMITPDFCRDDCPYIGKGDENDYCNEKLFKDVLSLLKAQKPKKPKKPIVSGMLYGNYLEHCPSCEIALPNSSEYGTSFYCYKCGQELKWDG